MFFRDGVRRIDFVLAYVDDKDVEKKQVREKCQADPGRPLRDACVCYYYYTIQNGNTGHPKEEVRFR